MNVAFVSNVVYPFVKGGAEKRIYEIGTRLVDRGHAVTVYGRWWWDGPRETEYEGMMLCGVSPKRELYTNGRRSISEALGFARDAFGPLRRNASGHDVVVASAFPYFPVWASKAGLYSRGTPLAVTWHEVWGGYWNEYLGALGPFGKVIERSTARLPHIPIAVSEHTAQKLARIGPRRDAIRVVPNGVDLKHIQSISPVSSGFDLLFAGRLIADKRIDVLLEAFDRIAGAYDVTLGIVGAGPELDTLRARTAALTHADRVTFTGFLDGHEDVLAHLRAAEVFVSPSTREGFGLAFVEAMATDCTVVAADHPDSAASEVIGDAGFLVSPSIDAVADAIRRALDGTTPRGDPHERVAAYDWNEIARRAERVYASVGG
jgi:glycosyltransferase involved in cell wall biosynthesis